MSTTILNEPSQLLLAHTLSDLIERDKKLTPASLARKLGIPTNKITRILNGDVTDPKASTLLQIANYFSISIEQLLGIEPIQRQSQVDHNEVAKSLPIFEFKEGQFKSSRELYRWIENDLEGEYYALAIETDLYEPTFPQSSILIISDMDPEDRSFVVVKRKDSTSHSIKKYVTDGNQVYLYPINPQLPVEVYEENLYTISGVVLEVHQRLRRKK